MNWLSRLTVSWVIAFSLIGIPLCSFATSFADYGAVDPLLVWSQGNKHFTTTFYPQVKKSGHNFVFSPLSLQIGLAMTAELAIGATQQEIMETGVLPEEETTRRDGVEKILACLNTSQEDELDSVQLNLTNGAWLSSKVPFHSSLKELLCQHYKAELHPAAFHLFPEETREEINTWVEENTQHQIQNLLPEGTIDRQTEMVLVNTLYMHAPWAKPFNPDMTYEAQFYGLEKSLRPIPYMHEVATFGLLKEAKETIIELPFKRSASSQQALSLFIVLPHSGTTLNDVEQRLTTRRLDHWMANTQPTYIDLSLPKFKVSSSINAKEVLKKMGMTRPFSYEAEFDLSPQNDQVMITDIVHQAVFEVDELGGTGSAATAVVIGVKSCPIKPYPEVITVNRPFLIFVADKTSGVVLFAGRVMQPSS